MFGTWAGAVALTVRLYDQTHSTTWSSLLYVAEFAPTVLIGILLGRLLDRLPPVRALAVVSEPFAVVGNEAWWRRVHEEIVVRMPFSSASGPR